MPSTLLEDSKSISEAEEYLRKAEEAEGKANVANKSRSQTIVHGNCSHLATAGEVRRSGVEAILSPAQNEPRGSLQGRRGFHCSKVGSWLLEPDAFQFPAEFAPLARCAVCGSVT